MPVFQASGLASGLDTLGIVDALADAQRAPIRQLKRKQEAYKIQLSQIGNLRSAVEEFKKASEALQSSGVVGNTATEKSDAFTVEATPDASAGVYGITVTQLAAPPKWRTDVSQFTSKTDEVKAGTLKLTVEGTDYEITVEEGDNLEDVARAVNASSAPVNAAVIETGNGEAYLSLSGQNTGFSGTDSSVALAVDWDGTGSSGTDLYSLDFSDPEVPEGKPNAVETAAKNAVFFIDGVEFNRKTNEFSDAIPGVKMILDDVSRDMGGTPPTTQEVRDLLSQPTPPGEDPPINHWESSLVLNQSSAATQENMGRWVKAYNGINSLLQADLNIQAGQDRTRGLSGDPSIKALQRQLRELIIEEIPSLGNGVRTLADIGLKTANNGSISFDVTSLERALKKDPGAVNGLFQASDGILASIESLTDRQLKVNEGNFDVKKKSIEKALRDIEDQVLNKEMQIEKFRESMIARFTSMEQSVGASKSMGDYLKNVKFPGFSNKG